MMFNWLWLDRALFALALGFTAYTGYRIISVQRALPPGVCPIDSNNGYIYTSIGLLVLWFAVNFIREKKSPGSRS
jgi:hypothetical protein